MSEYQCYEFVALDKPLTSKQMAALRAISTRAEISPTRFWNEYEWGDLKADAAKLVERYFDAHLYVASWGTHRLMLRAPVARVDAAFRAGAKLAPRLAGRRTVAQLLAGAEKHRGQRERAETARAEKAKRAAEAARTKRLEALAKRVDEAWAKLEALVAGSAYEEAVKLASDLRDLAKRDGASASFGRRFEAMRKRQLRRRGFFDRWKRENEPRRW